MSNIHSLSGAKKDKDKDKPDEKMEVFSQSGKTSGTSVFRPTNRGGSDKGTDDLAEIVKNAKGQKDVSSEANDRNIGMITLYANGFRVGDGEFRDASIDKNKKFIEDLKNHNVPRELESEIKREWGDVPTVGIQLVDKSKENYVPNKNDKKTNNFQFDKSKGHSLSSSSSSSSTTTSSSSSSLSSLLGKEYIVPTEDGNEPFEIPIVLHDRKTIKVKVILSTTVSNIFQHVKFVSKVDKFELLSGYPPKALTDPKLTVETAKLKKEKLTQRKL